MTNRNLGSTGYVGPAGNDQYSQGPAINRNDIEQGINELNADRKEHFELVIKALKEFTNKEVK